MAYSGTTKHRCAQVCINSLEGKSEWSDKLLEQRSKIQVDGRSILILCVCIPFCTDGMKKRMGR